MQLDPLLDAVCARAPLSREGALRAASATLMALARHLPARLSGELCNDLPRELTQAPLGATQLNHSDALTAIYADVQAASGVEAARAVEHVQVVCEALATQLAPELCERVTHELPTEVQLLFTRRQFGEPPARAGHGSSLADGRPGSREPLSEAAPGSHHPINHTPPAQTQQDGVSEVNPHGDTKLSSASGLTQEREQESLARGRAKRP